MAPDFYGLPTRVLDNGYLRLEYLVGAGPRLVRLFLAGSEENFLAEVPHLAWETPFGRYTPYGGHRLCHAPEAMPRSYIPDNEGLLIEELPDGVCLRQPAEVGTGIQKTLEVHLHPEKMALTLHHDLCNEGLWAVELAPWAITQLRLGGVAILPQMVTPLGGERLLPNRHLVLWPYTHWGDRRLHLYDDLLFVEALPIPSPLKVGYLNGRGWIAYLRQGVLFCKRFAPQIEQPHPDLNCNVEVYADEYFIELETVAPLCRLEPGRTVRHTEQWEFYTGLEVSPALEDVREIIALLDLERNAPVPRTILAYPKPGRLPG